MKNLMRPLLGYALLGIGATLAPSSSSSPVTLPNVVATYPHDTSAFTEGLVLDGETLFESTGEFGKSTLRRVDLATGQVQNFISLPKAEFGEGLALVRGRLIQLTYQDGIAHVYDAASFDEVSQFRYEGEGWGLCYDGARLVMSDGTEHLSFRDPVTFEEIGGVNVSERNREVTGANELECIGGEVFANMWPTGFIYRIDVRTGTVLGRIDARGLLEPDAAANADILNGIAFDSNTGHLLLTGKLWPTVFEVELPPTSEVREASGACSMSTAPESASRAIPLAVPWLLLITRRRRAANTDLANAVR